MSGYFFHHTQSAAIYIQSKDQILVADTNVIVDTPLALYALKAGPNSESKLFDTKSSITYKNNVLIGRSDNFDCDIDKENKPFSDATNFFSPPTKTAFTGILASDFLKSYNKKNLFNSGKTPAIYGQTCVFNNKFINYDGKCGTRDTVVQSNRLMMDYSFPIYFKTGNEYINSGINAPVGSKAAVTLFHRPKLNFVNIADCVDLHCDGHKKQLILDDTGDLLGYKGSIFSESEYKWEGVTRNGHTYIDTQPGLGDYRIPRPMTTTLDGKRIKAWFEIF